MILFARMGAGSEASETPRYGPFFGRPEVFRMESDAYIFSLNFPRGSGANSPLDTRMRFGNNLNSLLGH